MRMHGGVNLGRVAGIPIILDYSLFISLALFVVILATDVFPDTVRPEPSEATVWTLAVISGICFFASILLHELAHSLVARLYGLPVHNITLFALGGVSQIGRESSKASQEFLIAVVGPLTSALLGGLFVAAHLALGAGDSPVEAALLWLGFANVALAVFNMVPGFPLDGGRVFRSLVWALTRSRVRATRWAARLGQGIGAAIAGVGLLSFLDVNIGFEIGRFAGLWWIFLGGFLFNAAAQALRSLEVELGLSDLRVRDLMSTQLRTVEADTALRWLAPSPAAIDPLTAFMVVRNDVVVGMMTGRALRALDPSRFQTAMVADVMVPAGRVAPIAPGATGAEALARLQAAEVGVLPVVEDGRLLGLVGLEQVAQALRAKAKAPRPAGS